MAPLLIPVAMELAKFAPNIIKLLTGSDKAAEVAGAVVNVAQTVTGTGSGEDALAALRADPGKVLDFQQAMAAQQVDMEKAYLQTVAGAQHMQEVALGQEDKFSKRFVYYLAAAWSVFAMAYFTGVTFFPPAPAGQRIADTVLGVLISTVLGAIMMYFYGSTKGSADKTRMLAQSIPPK